MGRMTASMKPVLLLLVMLTVCQSRHRANNWGSLDGAGEYTIQSRTRDQLDQYAGEFESIEQRDRKSDQRAKSDLGRRERPEAHFGGGGYIYGTTNVGGNMAYRMITTGSSIAAGAPGPSVAVDGNLDQSFTGGSCTFTNRETGPWWRVDLGDVMSVTGVRIFVPGEGMAHPQHTPQLRIGYAMDEVEIGVSMAAADPYQRCHFKAGVLANTPEATQGPGHSHALGDGASMHVPCGTGYDEVDGVPSGMAGRFVTVVNVGTLKILSLCEVQVFGWSDQCSPKQKTSRMARPCPDD